MKRKQWMIIAGLMVGLIYSTAVWAEGFPYEVEIEHPEINEEYLYGTFSQLSLNSDQYSELVDTVTAWSAERQAANALTKEKYIEQAAVDAEKLGDSFYGYNISENMSIMRADERILSLREEKYEYLGDSVYPGSFVGGVTFDVQTGEILELKDIVKSPEEFKEAAIDFIISYTWAAYGDMETGITEEMLYSNWDSGIEWYMNATGINIIFNEDVLGPYALEILEIPMTLAYAESYIKEEYLNYETAGVYAVQENIPLEIKDGEEKFSLILNVEEGEYDWEYSVTSGGNTLELGQYGYLRNAYYIRKTDGRHYLMFDADMASDDYTTYLFEIGKDGAKQTDTLFAAIDAGSINPDSFKMSFWLYTLGTYGAEKTYFIDENGLLGTTENEYTLKGNVENHFELKTIAEIPFNLDGEEIILPAGTGLRMVATDDESYARMQISETGEIGELLFERGEGDNSWIIYIDEKNAEECFEMLPYVG